MNKQEAHIVLNQVREGLLHPQSVIIRALTITGDIHARCTNLESDTSARIDDRDSPYLLPSALQTTQGEHMIKVEGPNHVVCQCDWCKAQTQEPVAWHYPGGSPDQCTTNKAYAEMEPAWIPLYTHPTKGEPTTK